MGDQRENKNIDWLRGSHVPLQTYGWSGGQLGDSLDAKNGKRPTDASPMIITSQPPGAFANSDVAWKTTFGASHDCVLGLFSGKQFKSETIDNISLDEGGIYRSAIGTADLHLYELIGDPGVQQIDFIVGHDTVSEATSGVDTNIETVEQARGLSMRVPMMAVGWGRTIGMRPTDPEPTADDKKRLNDDEHKTARETWKLGPVDLRWDKKRGVWAAWNDLITDHNEQNLGTLVFDTNPDETCGFPFLKGKLEDVWKVVITDIGAKNGVDEDGDKSGTVATHMGHVWAEKDEDEWQWAPLSSTFKIHRGDSSSGKCGDEVYTVGPQIEILTTTFFHQSDDFDGPICFSSEPPDKELLGCMKFDGAQWVPAIEVDICDIGGFELATLYDNDKELATKMIEICKMLLVCLGKADGEGDPDKMDGAAEASQEAADAADSARDALNDLNGGVDYGVGDKVTPGSQEMTQAQADSVNQAVDVAADSMNNLGNAEQNASDTAEAASDSQSAANQSAGELADAVATAQDTQAAADDANAAAAEAGGNDPSTNQTADAANAANAEAAAARNAAEETFNDANTQADADRQAAKDADTVARDAADAAEADANDLLEDLTEAGQEVPPDLLNEMQEAIDKAKKAQKAREDAGLSEEVDPVEELDDKLKEKCAALEAADLANAIAIGDNAMALGQAEGEDKQKALNDMTSVTQGALNEMATRVNSLLDDLGLDLPLDPETGEPSGLEAPSMVAPVACPTSTGSVEGPPLGPATTTGGDGGGTGGGSVVKPPVISEPPPPTEGGGGGTVAPPPKVPPPPPPTCPFIKVVDPCTKQPDIFGPCPAGKGSGTPGGTPDKDKGPGDPEQNPDGGVNEGGQVFLPDSSARQNGGGGQVF